MINAPGPPTLGGSRRGGFTATVDAGGCVVLAGVLVEDALDALRTALDLALLDPGKVIPIDAGQLVSIDPPAISELLRYQLLAYSRQRRFHLEHSSPTVAKALELLDVDSILMSGRELNLSASEAFGAMPR